MDDIIRLLNELGNVYGIAGVASWLVPIGICVVLPVLVVWLATRVEINRNNTNKAILIAALEKNPNLDVEQFMEKLSETCGCSSNKKEKLLKEKLLTKLLWAMICLITGLGITALGIYQLCVLDDTLLKIAFGWDLAAGIACISVGVAFFANYHVGKKMLAKEIEAEEQRITQQ